MGWPPERQVDDPGAVRTNLGAPPAVASSLLHRFMKSAAQGAATSIVVAADPALDGISGHYFVDTKLADEKLSKAARDADLAARLWEVTEPLVAD